MKEALNISFRNLQKRRKRSLLTILGVFIGIAAIFTLISLSQGLKESVKTQFNKIGADKILIQPGGGIGMIGGTAATLDDTDLKVITDAKGVDMAGGVLMKAGRLTFMDETKYVLVSGIPIDKTTDMISQVLNYEVIEGRKFEQGDKNVAYVGYDLAHGDFLKKQVKIGSKIKVEGVDLRVIGVNKKIGNTNDDTQIALPIDTAREIFNEPKSYYMIIAKADNVDTASKVAEEIKKDLRNHRNEKKGYESFTVATAEDFMQIFNNIIMIIQVFLLGVASISLIVGAIGIMNSMYTAVLERTKEIGIMKAIGATKKDIVQVFVIEAGIIGIVGGAVGVIIGYLLSKTIEYIIARALGTNVFVSSSPWWLFAGLIIFGFGLGAVAGLLPAKQAADLKPVDALRYE